MWQQAGGVGCGDGDSGLIDDHRQGNAFRGSLSQLLRQNGPRAGRLVHVGVDDIGHINIIAPRINHMRPDRIIAQSPQAYLSPIAKDAMQKGIGLTHARAFRGERP